MDKELVYVILDKKKSIDVNTDIKIKDIASVYCNNTKIQKAIEGLRILKGIKEEDWAYISGVQVTEKIYNFNENLDVTLLGSTEILIEIKSQEEENKIFEFIKLAFVSIILFLGTGIAIINFHEDVNMIKSMEKIYFTLTGIKASKPLIMSIPYSIGIGLGMIIFFNRVFSFSKRRKKEPGPMEVELYLYDLEMEDYILNEMKKGDKPND